MVSCNDFHLYIMITSTPYIFVSINFQTKISLIIDLSWSKEHVVEFCMECISTLYILALFLQKSETPGPGQYNSHIVVECYILFNLPFNKYQTYSIIFWFCAFIFIKKAQVFLNIIYFTKIDFACLN